MYLILEVQEGGGLIDRRCLLCQPLDISTSSPPPPECQETPTPANKSQINPASKLRQSWEWLRTLHEVLHEVHTTKICIHHCNDESLD